MDDSTTSLIEALRSQLEILNEKIFKLEKIKESSENKTREIIKLLDDRIEGFNADATLRKLDGEFMAARDCEIAKDALEHIKEIMISSQSFNYDELIKAINSK